MTYLVAVLAATCFGTALRALSVPSLVAGVFHTTSTAVAGMQSGELSDAEKERLLRTASLGLMGACLAITGRTVAALLAACLPLLASRAYEPVAAATLAQLLSTWQGFMLAGLAAALGYRLRIRG